MAALWYLRAYKTNRVKILQITYNHSHYLINTIKMGSKNVNIRR